MGNRNREKAFLSLTRSATGAPKEITMGVDEGERKEKRIGTQLLVPSGYRVGSRGAGEGKNLWEVRVLGKTKGVHLQSPCSKKKWWEQSD